MITVSTIELFLKSAELLADGYQRVELLELDGDNGAPAYLSFDAIAEDNDSSIDYETIPDHSDGEPFSLRFSPDSVAPYTVSFNEAALISHAFDIAIENCKTCLADTSVSAESRSEIVSCMKKFEAYSTKLNSFLRDYSNH